MPHVKPNPVGDLPTAQPRSSFLSPRWQRVLIGLCLVQFVLLVALSMIWNRPSTFAEPRRRALPYSRTNREPFFIGNPGPWGELEYARITVEPPDDFLGPDLHPFSPTDWVFPGRSLDQVRTFLAGCDLTADQRATLFSTAAAWSTEASNVVVTPGTRLILELSTKARTQIYAELGESELNLLHAHPYTFRDGGFEDWFRNSGLSPATLEQMRRLVYHRGEATCFTDLPEVIGLIPTRAEQRRLLKTLWRNSTVIMKLRVRPDSDVDALAAYWSRGWHVKDVRALLESLTRVPGSITVDVAHLLPPFARRRLNSFQNPAADQGSGHAPDCYWTAMNFFKDTPDDRFHDPAVWLAELQQNYTLVKEPTFGDVILFVTGDGTPIHAAVYVADDVVFTKNGADFRQPWIFMKLDDLLARYHHTDATPVHFLIHRLKGAVP